MELVVPAACHLRLTLYGGEEPIGIFNSILGCIDEDEISLLMAVRGQLKLLELYRTFHDLQEPWGGLRKDGI
jgi:hypothetical protein